MSVDRLAKVNREIVRVFGRVVREEAALSPDVMVTIIDAQASRNLRAVKVGVSVYPLEEADEVMSQLQDQIYDLQGAFNRKISFHPCPRIRLELDKGSAHAEHIERKLSELDRG